MEERRREEVDAKRNIDARLKINDDVRKRNVDARKTFTDDETRKTVSSR